MAKVQELEESLLAAENVVSCLEKSRESDKVGRVPSVLLYLVLYFCCGAYLILGQWFLCVA